MTKSVEAMKDEELMEHISEEIPPLCDHCAAAYHPFLCCGFPRGDE